MEEQNGEGLAVDRRVRFGFIVVDPHIVVYSTIMLMTTYAVYDEGTSQLTRADWFEIAALGIAPLFALSMAHAFSEAIDLQIREGRRLTNGDRWHLFRSNLQYLYVAVPPIVLAGIMWGLGSDANDAVGLIQILGIGSLFFWGAYAGRRAGYGWLRQTTFGLSYGLMGLFVLAVEYAVTH